MLRLIASVVLSVFIAAPAAASGSYLRGLTKANIVVAGVDRDSISCGVREEVLLAAVKIPIRAYTKILETFTYQVPVINVSITTLSPAMCSHFVRIEVWQILPVVVPHVGLSKLHEVKLWSTSSVISGDSGHVQTYVENLAKQLAIAWQDANLD